MIEIYPCLPQDMELLQKCAAADNHSVIEPKFIVEKQGQIIGALGMVPSITVWMDTQRAKIRDSIEAMEFWENHLRSQGAGVIGVPCVENSPFRNYMEKVGYLNGGATLYLKNLARKWK